MKRQKTVDQVGAAENLRAHVLFQRHLEDFLGYIIVVRRLLAAQTDCQLCEDCQVGTRQFNFTDALTRHRTRLCVGLSIFLDFGQHCDSSIVVTEWPSRFESKHGLFLLSN